ncbi:hypothetical protein HUJ05_002560 [Dendroctonus ponderosae]|nr:hypothetical protein HUJ05_002560 [Dendroctonus ponderosae]
MWALKARKMSRSDDAQSQTGPKRLPSFLDIFRVKSVSSANFKYVKAQFYNGSCASVTSIEGGSTLNLRNMEYRYEKVSTPISCERNPHDQLKVHSNAFGLQFVQLIVMKKQTNRKSQLNNQTEQDIVEGRTFSRWLSSEEGLENLKLFIFINTLLCFVLVCWPQVKEALDAAYYIYLDFTTQ